MPPFDGSHFLSLEVIYEDEHLIELRATCSSGDFKGACDFYSQDHLLLNFAGQLEKFDNNLHDEAIYNNDPYIGFPDFSLHFYRYDKKMHIAAHIQLSQCWMRSEATRPEHASKVALTLKPESTAIRKFIRHLRHMAETQSGSAILIAE